MTPQERDLSTDLFCRLREAGCSDCTSDGEPKVLAA